MHTICLGNRSLVAGVNLTMRAETTAVLAKAGMLTNDGRCKTLDAAADGYVRGEACVVHLLESVRPEELSVGSETAIAAQHAIVIRGTAVNQDGRSSSLTAPNGPSQQQVNPTDEHISSKNRNPKSVSTSIDLSWYRWINVSCNQCRGQLRALNRRIS